jgi:hypothetical protein
MKSSAERQREARLRKQNQGDLRQLNLWIHVDAHEILKSISSEKGKTMAEVIREILELHANLNKATRHRSQKNTKSIATQLKFHFLS